MPKITLQQMRTHWVGATHRFSLNLWNFEVKAGLAAKKVFQESFDKQKLNASNAQLWAKRKRRGDGHPILQETGTLRRSIRYKQIKNKKQRVVRIFTDPMAFMGSKRHRGFCFAAVHNAPDGAGFRTKHMSNMPQRQFIGHSDVLQKELEQLNDMIFNGFPK